MNRGTLLNCICPMNKRQGTMHKAHLIWITFGCSQQAKREGGKNSVVVQANIYLGKNRWAQNLPSNKWKSDVTKCECTKCCSVPKYILWDDISFQYNFSHSSQWTIFLPLCHSDHCPLGRQWKSSELLHSTPSASLTLTWLWLYFKTIFSIFISGSLQSFGKLSLFLHYY